MPSSKPLKVAFFSTQKYDQTYFNSAIKHLPIEVEYFEFALTDQTVKMMPAADVVCVFVNDQLGRNVVEELSQAGVGLIALRCAGFNNVDLAACEENGVSVVRVPDYSPYAVAEHTIGLILTLNRKIHKAFNRVREGNFALDGLLGFDLFGKTIGIIGCGKIGSCVAKIANGFGLRVLLFDVVENPAAELYGSYTTLDELLQESELVTLHCPLNDKTFHLMSEQTLNQMKPGAMLVNTSRGGLVDTAGVIKQLKSGRLGGLAIDVYEEEADMFFRDRSSTILKDDVFARLLTFPNVLITGHQAFFTHEALTQIAATTVSSMLSFANNDELESQVKLIRQPCTTPSSDAT